MLAAMVQIRRWKSKLCEEGSCLLGRASIAHRLGSILRRELEAWRSRKAEARIAVGGAFTEP